MSPSLRQRREIADLLVESLPVEAEVLDVADGWPSIVRLELPTGPLKLRLYCGVIHDPGRGRTEARPADERRMQNPGTDRPVTLETGSVTLEMGWFDDLAEPVVVMFDAKRREGLMTRQSLQVRLQTLEAAAETGWSVQWKGNGEVAIAMQPRMVPFYLREVFLLAHSGDHLSREDAESIQSAGELASIVERPEVTDSPQAAEIAERVYAQVSRALRDRGSGRRLHRPTNAGCAVCGVQLELVEAAHLWPATNPGSPDTIDNGVCLCRNHHRAFDYGLLRIEPETWRILIDESVKRHLVSEGRGDGLEASLPACAARCSCRQALSITPIRCGWSADTKRSPDGRWPRLPLARSEPRHDRASLQDPAT